MFASRQGKKHRILRIQDKNDLFIYRKKGRIYRRIWSEEDAALVRTWYREGVIRFFHIWVDVTFTFACSRFEARDGETASLIRERGAEPVMELKAGYKLDTK